MQVDFDKVQSYFESSQNISILNEYCQAKREPQPEYKLLTSENLNPIQLNCMGQVFVCYRSLSKNIGKKACAQAAVEYFTSIGKMKIDRQYSPLVFQVCTFAHLEPPVYSVRPTENGLVHVCHVMDQDFISDPQLSKSAGKNQCSKRAFQAICRLERVVHASLAAISQIPPAVRVESATEQSVGVKRPAEQPQPMVKSSFASLKLDESAEDGELEEGEAIEKVYEDYETKLRQLYESDSSLGKPFLNYRSLVDKNGQEKYKAQLIMGSRVRMSGLQKTQAEAKEMVCKQVYEEICASMEEYCSDGEAVNIPTYYQLLKKFVQGNGDENVLEFQFGQGGNGGYICTAIYNGEMEQHAATCLREHYKRKNAKEDACRDLYALLRKIMSNGSS